MQAPGELMRDAAPAQLPDAWWCAALAETQSALAAGAGGLSAELARDRLARFGPNRFVDRPARALWLDYLAHFRNPLVLVLLGAAAVGAATGERIGSLIVVALVVASVTIDFVQERRASRVAERLRATVAVRARVTRDGRDLDVPVAEVVPGDVVLLAAGDLVPADARVLEARDFFVQQANLTGEPFPVEKHAAELAHDAREPDAATNAVFMSTSVISGSARVLVCRTGGTTEIGRIAGSLREAAPPNAFEIGTRRFGLLIMRLTVLMVLFVLVVNLATGKPWPTALLFAVALAVGLTPELLPMVVSVTLAAGAVRMARRGVVVRRLPAIHNLGAMDVLCTDKTGTLTEARIRLERHVDPLGRDSDRVLELAYLNSFFETGLRSPLDEAILAHTHIDAGGWIKIDEVPFDFERRRVSVLIDDGRARLLAVKGAAEDVVRLSAPYEESGPGFGRALDDVARGRILALHDRLADEGFRVLGIACKAVDRDHPHAVIDDETGLTFCGFAAFLDPPKTGAGEALRLLAERGVTVKIVTGDNERVTQHVCKALGIDVAGVLTGAEIARLGDDALRVRAVDVNLFCRVSPAQKGRIIAALKRAGHTVGYLGDGVNDAPPLHAADVGLSVDTAVDVARQAAAMIMLRHDLRVLHDGVIEGRRTYANIMKYVMMGTSSNFGNMFSMAAAAAFLPFLPMAPVQILLNNMLYDVSEVPIPTDRVDAAEIARPRAWDMKFVRDFMWTVGPVSSLFDFLTFYLLLAWLDAGEKLFQTGWFVESMATQVLVIFVIRTRGRPWASLPSPWLAATSVAIVAIAAALPLTPLGRHFGFVAPPWQFYALVAALTAVYLVAVEAVKRRFFRRHAPV
ncbi:MAG TPA: magnesium-translocating P-type ATPase [Burkholderiales bacterium]|nr:magnesium-translocating P-type ATPase [Burkholderiales bacterium]